MSHINFIIEWNDIIEYQIRESDLKKPTEVFLFNALISYLQAFSIDLKPLITEANNDTPEKRRLFKAQFCQYIDHMYKFSEKSNSFCYYDLIHPSPKKTAHLLQLLLNYLLFHNMVKKDIVESAQNKIQKMTELQEMINKLKDENKKKNILADSINKKLSEYMNELPKISQEIGNLTAKERQQEIDKKNYQETLKKQESLILQLKQKEEDLRNEIVSEEELQSLLDNKKSLEQKIAEQEEIEKVTLNNNQARTAANNELSINIKRIEDLIEEYPEEKLVSAGIIKPKVEDSIKNLLKAKELNNNYISSIEIYSEKISILQKKLNEKMRKFKEKNKENEHNLLKLKTDIGKNEKHYEHLKIQLKGLEEDLIKEEERQKFMIECSEGMFKTLRL